MVSSSMKKINGIIKCPVCKKEFIKNGQSIYKGRRNTKVVYYCSYTCWRKDGNG